MLAGLDEQVRDVLLNLSILDRFCPALAEALMDRPLRDVLESIERDNLFLVPLDQHRTWYRFHHLFGELLGSDSPGGIPSGCGSCTAGPAPGTGRTAWSRRRSATSRSRVISTLRRS